MSCFPEALAIASAAFQLELAMCGIVGFSGGSPDIVVEVKELRRLLLATEAERGGDAFGWAWIEDGRMRCFKQEGLLSAAPELVEMLEGATKVIAHVRQASFGCPKHNINNHPHPCDAGWVVHNGTIDSKDIQYTLPMSSDCDSEQLAQMIEIAKEPIYAHRITNVLRRYTKPAKQHAVLGLWKDGFVACTTGKPLAFRTNKKGTYIASMAAHLGKEAKAFKTGVAYNIK